MKNNGLGRGLSSLIPQKLKDKESANKDNANRLSSSQSDNSNDFEKDRVLRIAPNKIKVNPMQPRQNFSDFNMKELVKSIREYGIIQPLIVTENNGEYELIAGERRLRSANIIGLKEVPAIMRDVKDQEKLEIALIENLQREDLNTIETAIAYRKLADEFNLSQEEIANRVGKSRSSIANTLRMLSLPEEIKQALMDGRISEGHAKYLAGIESAAKQIVLFKKILHNRLTVSDTEQEARRMGGTKKARIKINYIDKDKEFYLREFFSTKAEIKRKGKGGQIIIDFYSDEELNNIIEKIKT